MKKTGLLIVVSILGIAIYFSSCKKKETADTSKPVITVTGTNPVTINIGQSYTDAGATASDDVDGNISSKITDNVSSTNPNVNMKGAYTITYSVKDAAANTGTATRTVNVVNSAEYLTGAYVNAFDSCQATPSSVFDATITSSATINGRIIINNFGANGTSVNINVDVSGTSINVPGAQSLGGTSSITSGNGTVLSSSSPVKFTIAYSWTDGPNSDLCTSTYTK